MYVRYVDADDIETDSSDELPIYMYVDVNVHTAMS